MLTNWSTTRLALAAALPVELVNFFVVGYPAGKHLSVPDGWFAVVAGQWYLLHLPGLFLVNEISFLRHSAFLAGACMFLSGYVETTLLLAAVILPLRLLLNATGRQDRLLRAEEESPVNRSR
jgi:hypothetical protein